MISIRDARVSYGALSAVRDVNIDVAGGEVVALLGANGAGKTSLLYAVAGIVPMSGSVVIDGTDLARTRVRSRVRAGLALVPEGRQLFGGMTVFENLCMGSFLPTARRQRKSRLETVYELFPVLKKRADQVARTMSGGEQQMLAIGRGLMGGPKALMVDEPSLGVAPVIVDSMMEAFRRLADGGMAVLLVEQNAVQALNISDRAYVMSDGEIVTELKSGEFLEGANLADIYFGLQDGLPNSQHKEEQSGKI